MPENVNTTQMILSALDALTETLRQNTELQRTILTKAEETSTIWRGPTPEWIRQHQVRVSPGATSTTGPRPTPPYQRVRHGSQESFDFDTESQTTPDPYPPDSQQSQDKEATEFQQYLKTRKDFRAQGKGRIQSTLGAFSTFAPQKPAPQQDEQGRQEDATLPPDSGQRQSQSFLQNIINPTGGPTNDQFQKDEQALTWAVLGEHGGPAAIRNMYLEQYGLRRSMQWAQQAAAQTGGFLRDENGQPLQSGLPGLLNRIPGVSPGAADALTGAFTLAANHPWLAYGAYKGVQGVRNSYQTQLSNQAFGQQFGYGAAPGGQGLFGLTNPLGSLPWNTANQVGIANQFEQRQLMGRVPFSGMFGGGLTSAQAQDVTGTLSNQGFAMQPMGGFQSTALSVAHSVPLVGGALGDFWQGLGSALGIFSKPQGDAATIANSFMQPLMSQFPGLSGQDLGQFDAALRNSGTSIGQLRGTLQELGTEARATKENVGQFAASLAKTGQQFEAMGSSPQGGYALGAGFTDTTALDPQIASQMAQSPLFQGMVLSQTGILPSGIGDMNAGAFTQSGYKMLDMMKAATQGFNRNHYETINGVRLLTLPGQQAQYDQIAAMTGLPSNIVKRMLGDQKGNQARALLEAAKGEQGNNTGLWGELNKYQVADHGSRSLTDAQWHDFQNKWNKTIAPNWRNTGISHGEMKRLTHITDVRKRMHALRDDLAHSSGNDKWNQIKNTPSGNTVQIQLTGKAAQLLQFSNGKSSVSKRVAGAGMHPQNAMSNSPISDLLSGNPVGFVSDLFS